VWFHDGIRDRLLNGTVPLAGPAAKLAALQNEWIAAAVATGRSGREPHWSEAVAVGRRSFVEGMQAQLGIRALHRCGEEVDGAAVLRDPTPGYGPQFGGEMATLGSHSPLDSTLF
jgi:hypothetical protein